MIGSKSALEAIRTPTGGEEKRSGTTVCKACPEIRKARRVTHSVCTLATGLAGVPPAEKNALHDRRASAPSCDHGLESGKWTDGVQKTRVWPDLVSTSSKAVNDTAISGGLDQLTKPRESH